LFGEGGLAVKELTRTAELTATEGQLREIRSKGFHFSLTLPMPSPGGYQVRAMVRDGAGGRTGSARQFLRAADWKAGALAMSSLAIKSETPRRFAYEYTLFNVGADAEKRSSVEVWAQVFRDGSIVADSAPVVVTFPPSEDPGRRASGGVIKLTEATPPGH